MTDLDTLHRAFAELERRADAHARVDAAGQRHFAVRPDAHRAHHVDRRWRSTR